VAEGVATLGALKALLRLLVALRLLVLLSAPLRVRTAARRVRDGLDRRWRVHGSRDGGSSKDARGPDRHSGDACAMAPSLTDVLTHLRPPPLWKYFACT
jgi:hypothetical protein